MTKILDDVARLSYEDDIGLPGECPYTRGPHASMYRGRPWTIRQVAGFGQAEDTNARYKYPLAHGETGLSTDFDMLMRAHCQTSEATADPISQVDGMGGMIEAVASGSANRTIADSAWEQQQRVELGEQVIVGVNAFADDDRSTRAI